MISTNDAQASQPAPYFRARRITHANIFVVNVDATMDFYTRIAGLEEVYRTPATGGGFVSNGNTHHDMGFLDIRGPLGFRAVNGRPGLYHLGFEVERETDLVAGYERAVADEIPLRPVDHDITHSLYSLAPNGFTSEIYADVIQDFRHARSGIVTKPKPKWEPGITPPIDRPCYHPNPVFRRVESAALHPQRFSHVAIVVDEYEASLDHYVQLTGMTPVIGGRDSSFCALAGTVGERNLFVFRRRSGGAVGCHHIAFRVDDVDDLKASVDTLRARGITPELVIDHPSRFAVYLRDPDGVLLQFYADRAALPFDSMSDDLALLLA